VGQVLILKKRTNMEQETIEEAANNWIKNTSEFLSVKNGFIEGAKSDAARDYWFKIFKEQSEKN
jgi:hypothetical protein